MLFLLSDSKTETTAICFVNCYTYSHRIVLITQEFTFIKVNLLPYSCQRSQSFLSILRFSSNDPRALAFFCRRWQIPGDGDSWAVNSPGVGTKKEGKCPILRQHCNIFHWSHSESCHFKHCNVRFFVSMNVFLWAQLDLTDA